MAKLDRFFKAMHDRKAKELQLISGRSPAFLFDDGLRPASSVQPGVDQLLALLAEVVEEPLLTKLRADGAAETTIQRPDLPPMTMRAKATDSAIEVIFSAADPSAVIPEPAAVHPAGAIPVSAADPEPVAVINGPGPAEIPPPPQALPRAALPASGKQSRGAEIDSFFHQMVECGASDLHLSADQIPFLRVDGEMVLMEGRQAITADAMWTLLEAIVPEKNRKEFHEVHDTDFAYEIEGLARFRANIFMDRLGPGAVFRTIPAKILTADDLNLSSHVRKLCLLKRGLVLVTGPTGSGKSTTLTAMIDHINKIRQDHIITIEDPIEFVHKNIKCLINQREVGLHTSSFKRALRAALREDPDIVLVGELRDLETIAIAIETAETGHLVFGTLHTTTAISTVDRIVDQFPPEQQSQVRTMLAESLSGVIAQNLCKKIGGGRIAALEVLIGIPSVANLIREGKTFQIPSIMQTGKKYGMVTINEALVELVKNKQITPEEAWLRAADKTTAASALKSAGCDMSFLETLQPA